MQRLRVENNSNNINIVVRVYSGNHSTTRQGRSYAVFIASCSGPNLTVAPFH